MKRKEWKQRPDQIEIDIDDVKIILGDEFGKLYIYLETTFCGDCTDHSTTVVDYRIFIDKLDDLIFVGHCAKCRGQVVRVIEVGETEHTAEIARHIKMVKRKYV